MKKDVFLPNLPLPSEETFLLEAIDGVELGLTTCSCKSFYHPMWGCLKAVGRMRGLYYQAPLLYDRIRPLLKRNGHVLIAGSADECVLQLLAAIGHDMKLCFTVVDQCEMPLRLIEKRFRRAETEVITLQTDLAELPGERCWDMAIMHYTMSFMDTEKRHQVLQNLHRGLTTDGLLVCAVLLTNSSVESDWNPTPEEWTDKARFSMQKVFRAHPDTLEEIEKMLPAYGVFMTQLFVNQPDEVTLVREFEKAGLSVLKKLDQLNMLEPVPESIPPVVKLERVIFILQKQERKEMP